MLIPARNRSSNILLPPICSHHRLLCSMTNTREKYERTQQGNLLIIITIIIFIVITVILLEHDPPAKLSSAWRLDLIATLRRSLSTTRSSLAPAIPEQKKNETKKQEYQGKEKRGMKKRSEVICLWDEMHSAREKKKVWSTWPMQISFKLFELPGKMTIPRTEMKTTWATSTQAEITRALWAGLASLSINTVEITR